MVAGGGASEEKQSRKDRQIHKNWGMELSQPQKQRLRGAKGKIPSKLRKVTCWLAPESKVLMLQENVCLDPMAEEKKTGES